ncbi:MAG: ECF transporter S component [Acutalibacteraceae bacterium]
MQKKSTLPLIVSLVCFLVLCPLVAVFGALYFESRSYYLIAVLMIIISIIPFFFYFEHRRIKTSELVTVAVMVSICVVSRIFFIFVPQVKPMCAFVVVTGCVFGANVGFVTGALSIFISNFAFGQGMFTPFQMLGMGLVGFLSGVIFYKKDTVKNRLTVSLTGAALCFFLYGFIVDTCSVLMLDAVSSPKEAAGIYASGVIFNLIHAAATFIVLMIVIKPMNDKLSRLRIKYGIFAYQ